MSFYKKKLEEARKQAAEEERMAKMDGGGSKFGAPTAAQQSSIQQEGLMRPKARPGTGGEERQTSLGMQLMRQMAQPSAPEESLRPQARPGSTLGEKRPTGREDYSRGDGSFRDRLKSSESGGDSGVQITLEDGRTMTGAYQFGDARLKDYMKSNKAQFSTEEFRKNPELQERVFQWHMADIDRTIDNLDTKGMSRDGLRAVAHLGGKGGMIKYVKSGGTYNPADKFGTSLSKYYNKFK